MRGARIPDDLGRLVVRQPGGRQQWPKIGLYAANVPAAITWILRRRDRIPPYRRYHWIERIGESACRPPTTKTPKESA